MITRRKLLIALSLGSVSTALPSFAQPQTKLWRIGFLASESRPPSMESHRYGAFVRGLRELGYVEGKNIVIEWRFADGKRERLPGLAAELVRLKVDAIVAPGGPAISAAQRATTAIPIVMGSVGDPVGLGFVASLSRPGGNITGVSNVAVDLSGKNLEFLLALVPKLSRVALLLNPASPISPLVLKQFQAAAKTAGVSVAAFEAGTTAQIDSAFGAIVRSRHGALIVARDPFLHEHERQIAALAAKHLLPAIFTFRPPAEAGALMSYAPNDAEIFRQAARYVNKILKGAKPADLPVEEPMKLELVIKRSAAKALGLTIPQELLIRADEVIE